MERCLQELSKTGDVNTKRAVLQVLCAFGAPGASFDELLRLVEGVESKPRVRCFAVLLSGGDVGPQDATERRADLLVRKVRLQERPYVAATALYALFRIGRLSREIEDWEAMLDQYEGFPREVGALLLYLAKSHPQSRSAIDELLARTPRPHPFVRASAYVGSAWHQGSWRHAVSDVDGSSSAMARAAAIGMIPPGPEELEQLERFIRDEERALELREALLYALSRQTDSRIAEAILLRLADSEVVDALRPEFLRAAIRLQSESLLAIAGRRRGLDAESNAAIWSALAGLRCFADVERPLTRGPSTMAPDAVEPLLERARTHLREGPATGSAEAAFALVIYGAEIPPEVSRAAQENSDFQLVQRLGTKLRTGQSVDQRVLRRVGIRLCQRHVVDPDFRRDAIVSEVIAIGLGGHSVPFGDLGYVREHDLPVPDDSPSPIKMGEDDAYFADLVFWLQHRPFHTSLEQYLGER